MLRKLSRLALATAMVGLLAGTVPRSYAGPVTLDDLLKGASLQVGDLVFSNFGNFSSVGFSGGKAVDPKLVAVVPTFYNGAPGLVFQSASQFVVGKNQQQETHFTFDVVASANLIAGAALSFTAASYGGGAATIAETVSALPNGLLVSTLIPNNYIYGDLSDGLTSLTVSKDISLYGGSDTNALTYLSDFTQSFGTKSGGGGGGGATPEPASITLLGIGVAGLIGYRWRATRMAKCTAT